MKKLFYPLLGLVLLFSSCNKEQEETTELETPTSYKATSTHLKLSVNEGSQESLLIKSNGLKSLAIEFSSTVSIGDTMYWELAENSNLLSIEDIVIVTSDCGAENFFKDGIIFNEDKTKCYGVISEKAYGRTKYDIVYIYKDGTKITDDPEVKVDPPTPPGK